MVFKDRLYRAKAKQFSLLKENYHKLGAYNTEDEAFVEYMRCYRKTHRVYIARFCSWLLDFIGGYGTRPLMVFSSMLIVIVAFWGAFSYLHISDIQFEIIGKREDFSHYDFTIGLYISLITFLTIGDSQISPTNELSSILVAIEAFIGLFLMSYFIVALVRKTLR